MKTAIPASWNIDPGKWPHLLVAGENITPEQADHLLIRTADFHYLDCNDDEWNRTVGAIVFGDENLLQSYNIFRFHQARARAQELHVLPLEYLSNYRIASAWIGGSRGWCDWDGRIGCTNYNIGKWPTFEEVGAEWAAIAAAFPYLDLTAQLISDEGAGGLCAQWRVKDGVAVPEKIGKPVATHAQMTAEGKAAMDRFLDLLGGAEHTERGVTAERLQQAIDAVEDWATAPAGA